MKRGLNNFGKMKSLEDFCFNIIFIDVYLEKMNPFAKSRTWDLPGSATSDFWGFIVIIIESPP